MKPKFTPDPIHEGASKEEILSWAQRQFERIEDWWPKDLSDRVEELESRNPQQTGTWPIVDSSSVSFGNVTAGQTKLTCALAWWPVEPGYTQGQIEDIAADGLDLAVQGPNPITEANYLSTDVRSGASSTRCFDGTYPIGNQGLGYFAKNATAYDISALTENDCAIQFYVKRQNVIYDTAGERLLFGGYGQTNLTPPGWGGWGVFTNDTLSTSGPAKLNLSVGLTSGRVTFQTDTRVITNNTWHKIRIEWTASTLTPQIEVDDTVYTYSTSLIGSGTPQRRDLTNTSPSGSLGVFLSASEDPRANNSFNGLIDDIRLSTCINV